MNIAINSVLTAVTWLRLTVQKSRLPRTQSVALYDKSTTNWETDQTMTTLHSPGKSPVTC